MPINNITQTISELPAAGRRGVDVQTTFVTKQEDFQDHLQGTTITELNTVVTQMNTMSGEMNTTASQVNTDASTATTKAGEASASASSASTSASTATTQAVIATNASTKASQWADNAYNVAVETGKYSAKHWSTVAQNATSGKIDKVTSTDNAIVRFDGTTGAVQNSGVIVDDNGNIGIGTSSPDCSLEVVGNDTTVKISNNNIGLTTTALQIGGYSGSSLGSYGTTLRSIHNFGDSTASSLAFELAGSEKMRIDQYGNIGMRVTPNSSTILPTIFGTYFMTTGMLESYSYAAASYQSGGERYITTGKAASAYVQANGVHSWSTAPSGTVGNIITWAYAMILTAGGHLLVGQPSGTSHAISGNTYASGLPIIQFGGDGTTNAVAFFAINQSAWSSSNAAATAIRVGNSTTGRSINAVGSINAYGADYAEYEYSNDITIVKGQIVGFKADGTLTDKYSEAIRFAIKSTNPSIVGGDVWGGENIVGKRPEQPVRKLDKTEQVQIKDSEEFETVIIEAGDTDAEWEAIEAKYKAELADFETRLEVERQKVDRIAYAGKVPVNVYGATAGQYIIAIEKDGVIDGLTVNKADMTFAQYQDAVGRVNKILDDGRAEVAVIIH